MTVTQVHASYITNQYPFSAIVGQDQMKLALVIAAVEPKINGVLVFGDRGTGKSTAVRALANVLDKMDVVRDCPYHCDPARDRDICPSCRTQTDFNVSEASVPVVDLPLGATEDRIAGSLDLEHALKRGEKRFEPGLLAKAHRGFLYIDEVNLLEDHLVDLLLDVSASGENVVERDGISVRHAARFVLVGSGNPEEGELRPQLLDRFGLSVDVTTTVDLEERVAIIRRRDAFEQDPQGFAKKWHAEQLEIKSKIARASNRLQEVATPDEVLEKITELCVALETDGLRGELTLIKAARAVAALEDCNEVDSDHVRRVAPMALQHRLRRDPLDESGSASRVARSVEHVLGPEKQQRAC